MVLPMTVRYETVLLDCGHEASFYEWMGEHVHSVFCRHCGGVRAVVPSATEELGIQAAVPQS